MKWIYHDGGRAAAGYIGRAGDCVCRSIVIASGRPYNEVYNSLAAGNASQRRSKYAKGHQRRSARDGIFTHRKWFKDYMQSIGFEWTPTMGIGTGCKVHLTEGELPMGKLVVAVSKHYTAVLDGDIYDTFDPRREVHTVEPDHGQELKAGQWKSINGICSIQRRCVYGYWKLVLE
jgi:hypothetical protein